MWSTRESRWIPNLNNSRLNRQMAEAPAKVWRVFSACTSPSFLYSEVLWVSTEDVQVLCGPPGLAFDRCSWSSREVRSGNYSRSECSSSTGCLMRTRCLKQTLNMLHKKIKGHTKHRIRTRRSFKTLRPMVHTCKTL
jgi:hypothetical protein